MYHTSGTDCGHGRSSFYDRKNVSDGQTKTSIRELKAEESTDELARILGGAKITDTVRQNAKEMQELAAQIKKVKELEIQIKYTY